MPPPGAAMAAAGDLIPAGLNFVGGMINSALNVHESRANRRFQRNMANTEMQRRVADLRAAGINPMLAVGGHGMGGASVPHTEAPRHELPRVDPMIGAQLMESRARTAKDLAESGKLHAETGFLNDSMEDRLNFEWARLQHEMLAKDLTRDQSNHIQAQIVELENKFELMQLQKRHSALDIDRAEAESSMYKLLGGFGAAGKAGLLRIPSAALKRLPAARLLRRFPKMKGRRLKGGSPDKAPTIFERDLENFGHSPTPY